MLCIASKGTIDRLRDEDRILRETFGKKWHMWAKEVQYWLIPGVY